MQKKSLFFFLLLSVSCIAADGEEDPFLFDLTEESSGESAPGESFMNTRFSNTVEGRLRKFTRQSDFLSSRLRLDSSFLADNRYFSFYVNGLFDYDEAVRPYDRVLRASLYELYTRINGSELGLSGTKVSLGKMRVSWGVNDGRSTVDVLNTTYMKDPMANGRTVSRWPSWRFRLEQSTDAGNFEGVILPFGKDRKSAKHGSPWELSSTGYIRDLADKGMVKLEEHHNPKKVEWGIRYIKYMSGFDFGAAGYFGFSDLPALKRTGNAMFLMEPVKSQVFNINSAMTLGNSTLRAEAAYSRDVPVYDDAGNLYYTGMQQFIAGWDRNFDYDIYGNVQFFFDHYNSYTNDYGMTFSLSQKYLNDALSVGVNALYGYRNEHSVEAFAEYIVSDSLTLNLRGYMIGGGPDAGFYKTYDRNDYVEAGFKYYL